ncbi:MAG TPA: hypothetical protein VK897_14810 [Anaerolineales bacterium]|nr:hypothetical protein [Anaerolineales bacterium]
MPKNSLYLTFIILILTIVLTACGSSAATPTPVAETTATDAPVLEPTEPPVSTEVSTTADPCLPPQLEAEVQKVHRHMREFDDASILASNMAREQLSDPIADLQRIRREAEDEKVPECLAQLQVHQVEHMNSVINTLVAFMGGTDQQTLEQGIALARQQHDDYTLELAKVLGLTVVPANTPPVIAPTETPTP